jgi:hypothetical protein
MIANSIMLVNLTIVYIKGSFAPGPGHSVLASKERFELIKSEITAEDAEGTQRNYQYSAYPLRPLRFILSVLTEN